MTVTYLSPNKKTSPQGAEVACARDERELAEFSASLIEQWCSMIVHMGKNPVSESTADNYADTFRRFLNQRGKHPWELTKLDYPAFLAARQKARKDVPLALTTVGTYSSALRSFQTYFLMGEVANVVSTTTGVQPLEFIDEENSVPVKRARSNQGSRIQWALTDAQIDAIENELLSMIKVAKKSRDKSYLALIRDRVMFHLCYHFALRISELVTIELRDFSVHSDREMAELFGDFGILTVSG